jgi:hypothetical protein
LLDHPKYVFTSVWENLRIIFNYNLAYDASISGWYAPPGFYRLNWLTINFYYIYLLMVLVLSVLAGIALLKRTKASFGRFMTGFVFAAMDFPLALVIYHADSMEVPRHALIISLHSGLCLLVLLCLLDDMLQVMAMKST